MPDKRNHRGPHPEDVEQFAESAWQSLRTATVDLSWLLSRGYSMVSAVKLVGDRYQLRERQRLAVMRSACSDDACVRRQFNCRGLDTISGQPLLVDGYNVLTSVEAALGGGVILKARDECYRDMASMHGTYRRVAETIPALHLIGEFLLEYNIGPVLWYLDSPVSNSGRLKVFMQAHAAEQGWDWRVELTPNPDAVLAASMELVATADSVILDHCACWINLARGVISQRIPTAFVVDLSGQS